MRLPLLLLSLIIATGIEAAPGFEVKRETDSYRDWNTERRERTETSLRLDGETLSMKALSRLLAPAAKPSTRRSGTPASTAPTRC